MTRPYTTPGTPTNLSALPGSTLMVNSLTEGTNCICAVAAENAAGYATNRSAVKLNAFQADPAGYAATSVTVAWYWLYRQAAQGSAQNTSL